MDHPIGPQTLSINGDTAFITLNGDFLVEHMRQILALLDGIGGGEGKYYILADVRRLNTVHPEARRLAGAWRGIGRAAATAIIGANLLTRTLILLVSRASTLLSKTKKSGKVDFFKTAEEAHAWIDSHRSLP